MATEEIRFERKTELGYRLACRLHVAKRRSRWVAASEGTRLEGPDAGVVTVTYDETNRFKTKREATEYLPRCWFAKRHLGVR